MSRHDKLIKFTQIAKYKALTTKTLESELTLPVTSTNLSVGVCTPGPSLTTTFPLSCGGGRG